ncbi:MAG TPA: hypothetical protein VLL97_03065 [Acidobacteriota bacterium]|nr:hypothetical protein [Acidobacteriota bacterium]
MKRVSSLREVPYLMARTIHRSTMRLETGQWAANLFYFAGLLTIKNDGEKPHFKSDAGSLDNSLNESGIIHALVFLILEESSCLKQAGRKTASLNPGKNLS